MKHLNNPFLISSIALSFWTNVTTASAQIVPDNTLPVNSQVTGCPVCLIEGGTVRGVNLFHSFEEFSVQIGGEAFFNNALDIENIFGRVTGANISDIDGWIRANGTANLFLINPNGIIFGENARLDVGGSFVASTANSFTFPDGSEFSATNPQAPPLLTINITPGLQYGANSPGGRITNAGNLNAGQDLTLAADNLDLQGQLSAGRDLTLKAQDTVTIRDSVTHPFIVSAEGNLLVQGNQTIDIFTLNHPDSGLFSGEDMVLRSASPVWGDAHYWSGGNFRIEQLDGNLGDLASPEDPVIRALGDVLLNRYTGASLHIFAGGWVAIGTVTITATDPTEGIRENVTLSDGTVLAINGKVQPTLDVRAGLDPNVVGSPIGLTGNNFFDVSGNFDDIPDSADIAIGEVFVDAANGVVFLTNQYQPNPSLSGDIEVSSILTNDFVFTGNAGSVIIDSRGAIKITNQIDSSSTSGNAGNITLIANDIVSLTGGFIVSETPGVGAGGDTRIQSGSVLLKEGAVVSTATLGAGDAGNLTVETGELLVRDGSQLIVSTFGTGNGGELNVNATQIELIGANPINGIPSGLFADVRSNARGNGGDLTISTQGLRLIDGAALSASTYGEGDAGELQVVATDRIEVIGSNPQGNSSSIRAQVNSNATGKGGNLTLESRELLVSQGGQIGVSTFGTGDGGELNVNATQIELIGTDPIDGSPSGLFGQVGSNARGNGGDVTISTQGLRLIDGANLSATTYGQGDAGKLKVVATDRIEVMGYDLDGNSTRIDARVNPNATGKGGNLTLESRELLVSQGGQIDVSTFGTGNGGELNVNAAEIELIGTNPINGLSSGLFAYVAPNATGNGGDVTISTQGLRLIDGAILNATTFGKGNAGELRVVATDRIELIGTNPINGLSSGLFASVGANATGNGGDVILQTQDLGIIDGAILDATTYGKGNAGDLRVVATDRIEVIGYDRQENSSSIRAQVNANATGKGGNLSLETAELLVSQGGQISVATFGTGDGGELNVNASEIELIGTNPINGSPSALFASVGANATGNGGDMTIDTQGLRLVDGATLNTTTFGKGNAGELRVVATDRIEVIGSDRQENASSIRAQVEPEATGKGGNLTLETAELLVSQGGQISVATLGTGDGGQLNVNATQIELIGDNPINGSPGGVFATVEPNATGKGGDITISTQGLRIVDGATLSATTFGKGNAGELRVVATDRIEVIGSDPQENSSSITVQVNPEATGRGGNLTLETAELSLSKGGQISVATFGTGDGGELNVNASEIELVGTTPINGNPSSLFADVAPNATGKGGDVTISTQGLRIVDGATLSALTGGIGDAGDLTVTATEKIEVIGTDPNRNPSSINAIVTDSATGNGGQLSLKASSILVTDNGVFSVATFGNGVAGNLTIETQRLTVADDASVSASTASPHPEGTGGNLTINARESLQLRNQGRVVAQSTGAAAAGGVTISTPQLYLENDSQILASNVSTGSQGIVLEGLDTLRVNNNSEISASTRTGTAGSVRINVGENPVESVFLNNSRLSVAATSEGGKAGGLTLNSQQLNLSEDSQLSASNISGVSENITLEGLNTLTVNNSLISASTQKGTAGSLSINTTESVDLHGVGGLWVEASQGGTAGNLTVKTTQMSVHNEASVTVSSPSGQAGNLTIKANSLQLDQGQLTAETGISGVEGGANISLQNLDTLLMTNESLISAKASGDANGGNIDITTIFLLALPPEGVNGSDIIASAERGDGGRITITGEGIFGIEERPAIEGNRTNDIDASSQFGNSGEIILDVSLDPSRGLTQLPSTLVDPSGQINRTCAASNRQSQFTVTGRGGLPENPTDLFSPDLVQDDFGTVIAREEDEEIEGQAEGKNDLINHPPKQIIEAQGWIIDEEGNVILTAYAPDGKPHSSWQEPVHCQVSPTASP
ncbi:haemagglutination activity domain protein [Coleofasciculus chthonoplastes PCC 7420]|uniref:Haemagglutination activity domain protein n=1 Tax=Coleofasciculus chthonoplastes PCC 7420 TaxID=118168 RepID=B4VW03_9CYAN|nr:filamentous hemagglutinin N-terminal domain-containing protein [Coleofasciculus chthonoplastes]EDX73954.1 haemagglutination activity domain protein [Coleofasciculus chthonoplastes PCC 7420]